jgi:hypothetical protein
MHAAGKFTMAYSGGALGTMARVKAAILLNGGVLTAMASFDAFVDYTGTPPSQVFSREVPRGVEYAMHAVFCYGFSDSVVTAGAGYWLCKNR